MVEETVRVTEVKGHAEDVDVHQGRVRLEDQLRNAEADAAAALGRRSLMLGVGCSRCVVIGTLLCFNCKGF